MAALAVLSLPPTACAASGTQDANIMMPALYGLVIYGVWMGSEHVCTTVSNTVGEAGKGQRGQQDKLWLGDAWGGGVSASSGGES